VDIDAIKVTDKPKIGEGRGRFARELKLATDLRIEGNSNVFRGGSQGKIIDLTKKEERGTAENAGVNRAIVSGGLEGERGGRQNGIDVTFPETTGFRVALKGMLNREDKRAVKPDTEAEEVPLKIRIINGHKGGRLGRRGMGEGISSIATIGLIVQKNTKSKEETLNILLNTGGVSLGETMKHRGSTQRTVTTKTSTAGATALDVVLPVHTEDHGIAGAWNWVTKHAEGMELIELLDFAGKPERPGVQRFENTPSERLESLFGGSSSIRANGEEDGRECGARGREGHVIVNSRETNRRDGVDVSHGQSVKRGIHRSGGGEEIQLLDSRRELASGLTGLRSEDKINGSSTTIMKLAQASKGISQSKDVNIVDANQIGTTNLVASGLKRRKK